MKHSPFDYPLRTHSRAMHRLRVVSDLPYQAIERCSQEWCEIDALAAPTTLYEINMSAVFSKGSDSHGVEGRWD
jgi:hypothetical protein